MLASIIEDFLVAFYDSSTEQESQLATPCEIGEYRHDRQAVNHRYPPMEHHIA